MMKVVLAAVVVVVAVEVAVEAVLDICFRIMLLFGLLPIFIISLIVVGGSGCN